MKKKDEKVVAEVVVKYKLARQKSKNKQTAAANVEEAEGYKWKARKEKRRDEEEGKKIDKFRFLIETYLPNMNALGC